MTSIPSRSSGPAEPDGLIEMTIDEATEVLRDHTFGRIAFAHQSWPVVLPVNYALNDVNLVVRTAPGSKLSSAPLHAVAFEVDDYHSSGSWGWSVLVQGPAFDITNADDERSRSLRNSVVNPIPPGIRNHWLMIAVVHISGRYFGGHPLTKVA